MSDLTGKVAVITGGNSGIGFATAKALKTKGARVIITGRRKEAVEKAAATIGVEALVADQSHLSDIDKIVSEIALQFGGVDMLVISAGITQVASIELMEESMYDDMMNINVKGAYFTLSKFIPILRENASVILVSSTSASVPAPQISVYSASKAAVNAIVKVAALELASRRIRVNAVSPGPIATEIMEKSGLSDPATQEYILSGIPLGRFGNPDEVAGMIAYLCQDEASFVTGSEFLIDGGHAV